MSLDSTFNSKEENGLRSYVQSLAEIWVNGVVLDEGHEEVVSRESAGFLIEQ